MEYLDKIKDDSLDEFLKKSMENFFKTSLVEFLKKLNSKGIYGGISKEIYGRLHKRILREMCDGISRPAISEEIQGATFLIKSFFLRILNLMYSCVDSFVLNSIKIK